MALILCLETATTSCSVALSKNGAVLAIREVNEGYTHSENLTVFAEEVMKEAGASFDDLDAIAVSKGPGSYTGLRIGVSAAKGFCFALDKPLIAINTLRAMATGIAGLRDLSPALSGGEFHAEQYLLCPMIDARRMEVYCAVYDQHGNEIRATAAEIIDENSFSGLLNEHKIAFFGDGASKCKAKLGQHHNAIFINDLYPSAKYLAPLGELKFSENKFEDVAYFEPYYLKDFIAGPKKNF